MSNGYVNSVCKGDRALGTACGRCECCVAVKPNSPPANVTRLHHALPMGTDTSKALFDLDAAIVKAVNVAKEEGLPQGLIVALLHGQAHSETARMVS